VEALEREVNNGGFHQFCLNSSREYASMIVDSLKRINCPATAEIAQNALNSLGIPDLSSEAIERAITVTDEVRDEKLGRCDNLYFQAGEVTENDVSYVADLANLELTAQERQRMLRDLNSILDYIDRLNELDTSNVPPMTQISGKFSNSETVVGESCTSLREDVLRACLPHTDAMKNAPETDGDFFKVPKVIEK
jgi:aspartyl-tRNA(Asn)/glutamyl-tRNA(Gln) amidotransferase subunit C